MADGPHVIVLGNEKGGTGKSTTAVHIAVALASAGLTVLWGLSATRAGR